VRENKGVDGVTGDEEYIFKILVCFQISTILGSLKYVVPHLC
jgi:hypothetical protein